ncbi:MAG: BrnT family toxin [Actinomycetia bacterium]|nr:BrnT family toxin [Actinomycetes bacterium]
MLFEFDSNKSCSNKVKHGIDFIEAQCLWDDESLIEIPAHTVDEPRYLVIGVMENKHYSAVIIYREENIRIISVRRSHEKEVDIYESKRVR